MTAFFGSLHSISYLCCVLLNAESLWVITWRGDTYILKAFSGRFGFDALRTSHPPKLSVRNKATETLLVGVDYTYILRKGSLVYIYINVGFSALLGLTDRVMRRPSKRGPGTGLAPRFLRVCKRTIIKNIAKGAGGGK